MSISTLVDTTMTASLTQFLKDSFATSEDEISEVVKYFKHIKVNKDEVLVESDKVCYYFFFVVKGCVKTCFIDSLGHETTRYIAFENEFISNLKSFIEQTPSSEYVCAIEPSELLAISYTDFRYALNRTTLFKDVYIKLLEKTYLYNHWRIETLLRLDAKQRYEYMLKNNKQHVQRLSNKNLSSFLGITQESLSRVKGKK